MAVICNDEGKVNHLPLNRVLEDCDIIAGTFFICGIRGENFSSLTEQQAQNIHRCSAVRKGLSVLRKGSFVSG